MQTQTQFNENSKLFVKRFFASCKSLIDSDPPIMEQNIIIDPSIISKH